MIDQNQTPILSTLVEVARLQWEQRSQNGLPKYDLFVRELPSSISAAVYLSSFIQTVESQAGLDGWVDVRGNDLGPLLGIFAAMKVPEIEALGKEVGSYAMKRRDCANHALLTQEQARERFRKIVALEEMYWGVAPLLKREVEVFLAKIQKAEKKLREKG